MIALQLSPRAGNLFVKMQVRRVLISGEAVTYLEDISRSEHVIKHFLRYKLFILR